MTEILTESFCERCGTRYTFESARPRARLKGVKVLSRGLKNFVLSDDTSIDEAMAAARSESDREASSHQLDAFHKTFSFCMSCRQYTCPNCWNEAEARCLSCAPLAMPEIAHDVHDLRELREAVLMGETAGNGADSLETVHDAWPTASEPEVAAEPGAATEVAAYTTAEVFGDIEAAQTPAIGEAVDAAPIGVAAEPIADAGDPAGKAASQTLGLLQRFRPGQSLDDELDAFERERDDVATSGPATEPSAATDDLAALHAERIAAASPIEELDSVVAIDVAAAVEELEPVETNEVTAADEAPSPVEVEDAQEPAAVAPAAVEPQPEPTPAEPVAPPIAAAATSDVVEQPTWRITALDPAATTPPAPAADKGRSVPVQASAAQPRPTTGDPQWPARPEWPSATAAAGLPFLGRPATPQGGIDALWAASNQELATTQPAPGKAASGIQPCISCGLSLSATARFCRRCGTLQLR